MPSIKPCPLCAEVTDTVVPGQTSTSPPRSNRKTDVSDPAVTEDPATARLPARTTVPDEPGASGTAAGWIPCVNAGTVSGLAVAPSEETRRTIKRLPAASQVCPTGLSRSTTTRVTGGAFRYWLTRIRRISQPETALPSLFPDRSAFAKAAFLKSAFGRSAFGKSMTSRGGFSSLLITGTSGRLDRISTAGPPYPATSRTLRTAAGAAGVASNFGVDCAGLEAIIGPESSKNPTNRLRTRGRNFITGLD